MLWVGDKGKTGGLQANRKKLNSKLTYITWKDIKKRAEERRRKNGQNECLEEKSSHPGHGYHENREGRVSLSY